MKSKWVSIFFLAGVLIFANSQKTYSIIDCGKGGTFFSSDTMCLGAGFVSKGILNTIDVYWKATGSNVKGALYFMEPGHHDSARFVFHNNIAAFPSESLHVMLGSYPVGTPIVFMYMLTDTAAIYSSNRYKKLYSGQNRISDEYRSERSYNFIYGPDYRWMLSGRVDSNNCEMGFGGVNAGIYFELKIFVTNVYKEQSDKYKAATPFANPSSKHISGLTAVSLSSATYGSPKIYYTLNGMDPDTNSSVYTGQITIDRTTTLKAFACISNDSQWVKSDILTENYILDPTRSIGVNANRIKNDRAGSFTCYNLRGQRTTISTTQNGKSKMRTGMYLFVDDASNKIVKQIVNK